MRLVESRTTLTITYVVLGIGLFVALFAIALLVLNSLKPAAQIVQNPLALPETIRWDNFARAWKDAKFSQTFFNSALLTSLTIILTCSTASLTAYVLARQKVKAWKIVTFYLLGTTTAPIQLFLFPLYFGFAKLGLINNVMAVAFIYTAIYSPFAVMLLRTYFLAVPRELEEAALVDGASHWQVFTRVMLPIVSPGILTVALIIGLYSWNEFLIATDVDGEVTTLQPGAEAVLQWRVPEFGGQPIGEVGLAISGTGKRADGQLLVDYLRWDGAPSLTLRRPAGDCDFWRMAWVNGVDFYSKRFPPSFRISQNRGEGIIVHGTRQWTDCQLRSEIMIHLGNYGGVALRVQGLRRYYGVRLTRHGSLQLVKVKDDAVSILAEAPFEFHFETKLPITASVRGDTITAEVGGVSISASDDEFANGGIGLVINDGALSADFVTVEG